MPCTAICISYPIYVRLTWPLVGRSEEMRLIATALSDPDSSGVLIRGAAGVGKSRIAREALDAAASRGNEVRWVAGTSSARSLPLGALVAWAGRSSDSLELVSGAIRALSAAAPGTTVVIAVDDVVLLDDLSTFVMHQIVERRAAKVVLTQRSGEPIPTATQELWKDQSLYRLDLQPLSAKETASLVCATLGGPLESTAAEHLWRLTRGNALYLRNIVDVEVAENRLVQRDGYWRWSGDPGVPPDLVELIESRIGAMSAPLSDVLDVLAVGEPIDLPMLRRIADPAAVEAADMRGLITLDHVDGRVEVRVAHPLYGEVRRKRAAETRLRRLRGLIADELARSQDGDDLRTVVRRAELSIDSDREPSPDLLVRGAQGAYSFADMPLADRLADAAIRSGAGAAAFIVRALALFWIDPHQADAVLARTPTSGFTEDDRILLNVLRAGNTLVALADPMKARKLIDELLRSASVRTRGLVHGLYAHYWVSVARPDKAMKAAERFVLEELPGTAPQWASSVLVIAYGDSGHTTDAVAAADKGYSLVTQYRDAPDLLLQIGDRHVGALWQAGRINEARLVATQLRDQAADLPGVAALLNTALAGRAALASGDLDEACSLLESVVDPLFARGDFQGFGYRYEISYAIALAMRGMIDQATAALAHLEQHRHPSCLFVDYERQLAHAWLAACQGVTSEAIRRALTAAVNARANGQFAAEVMCLQTATQFGDSTSARRLRELEAIVEGPRVCAAIRFATALSRSDATELAAVSKDFEEMGDRVAGVDAAAHAALAYRKQERRGSALNCSTRAEALAVQCGGANTPALREAAEPLPLSKREREIATLIGQGLSNPQIAQRLTLSKRTVESHIYRATTKTGASTREELAALVRCADPALAIGPRRN